MCGTSPTRGGVPAGSSDTAVGRSGCYESGPGVLRYDYEAKFEESSE